MAAWSARSPARFFSSGVDQRQRDARMEIARLGERTMAPARIALNVLEVLRPARGEYRPGDAAVAWNRRGAHGTPPSLGPGPEATALAQGLGAVVHPDVGHPRLQERRGRLGDPAERRITVGRRGHQPRETAERGQ